MARPELSVIIVSYNTCKLTADCINSLIHSDIKTPYEIVVFDNASTDGTLKTLTEIANRHRNIRLIANDENIGFGRGNNAALRYAQGKYVLLLNSDTIALNNAVEDFVAFYKLNEKKYQFAGGKLLNRDLSPQPSCGPFFTPKVVFGLLFLRGDYWGLTRFSPTQVTRVDWVSGACIMTQKAYLEALGGFDEKIFMYMEEVDLLYRAKKQGWKTAFYPGARFIHLGSASSAGRTFPIVQVYKGYIYFYKKHYGRLAMRLLKIMLELKAVIAVWLGRIAKNRYLIQTYEEAYKLAQMA